MKIRWPSKQWGVRLYFRGDLNDYWGRDFRFYSSAVNYVTNLQEWWIKHDLGPGDLRIIDLKTGGEVTPKMMNEGYTQKDKS